MSLSIMAIINTSSDSFSGDGVDYRAEHELRRKIETAVHEGADILDIGGQSTRPGAEIISEEEELKRTLPAIRLARSLTHLPISIDTFKPRVAKEALAAGATILNDITGFVDLAMVRLASESKCDVVVMHMRGTPQTMSTLTDYPDGVTAEVLVALTQRTDELIAAGVVAERIIIDPGIGFAKTAAQSFELTRELDRLSTLGFRVLYGASNKSFIGKALADDAGSAPVEKRAVGTIVAQAYAMLHGATIIRVHDVAAAVQTRAIIHAIQYPETIQ